MTLGFDDGTFFETEFDYAMSRKYRKYGPKEQTEDQRLRQEHPDRPNRHPDTNILPDYPLTGVRTSMTDETPDPVQPGQKFAADLSPRPPLIFDKEIKKGWHTPAEKYYELRNQGMSPEESRNEMLKGYEGSGLPREELEKLLGNQPMSDATPDPVRPGQQTADLTETLRKKLGTPPASARAYADTMVGNKNKITEEFFTPDEIEILRETSEKVLAKGKKHFGYGDYGEGNKYEKVFEDFAMGTSGGTHQFLTALTDPRSSLSFTLGMANVDREDDGTIVIKDKYRFAAKRKQVEDLGFLGIIDQLGKGLIVNGLTGVGNMLGNLVVPQDEGRPVEIRIKPKKEVK